LGLIGLTNSVLKAKADKDKAFTNQKTTKKHRKKASHPKEIEADLLEAMYRCLQQMMPMLEKP
jgi:hypothetical protein